MHIHPPYQPERSAGRPVVAPSQTKGRGARGSVRRRFQTRLPVRTPVVSCYISVMQIAPQKVVSIEYTLKDAEGTVLDSSEGREPLAYLHGAGNIVVGLEKALEGKAAGDNLEVQLSPEEAYGPRDDKAIRNVPTRKLSPDRKVAVGNRYRLMTSEGALVVTVLSVKGDYAMVDGNHPLAGMSLNFSVKVVDVRDATAEELAHGHVHGPGGHHH